MTAAIVSIFAEYDNRIKIINQENKMQGAARNRGIEIAQGEYIGFVDSDDWIDLNLIEKIQGKIVSIHLPLPPFCNLTSIIEAIKNNVKVSFNFVFNPFS